MNKLTNIAIGAVAVIALIAAFTYDQSPKIITGAQGPQGPRGEQGIPGRDGKDGVTTVITKTEPKLGGFPGADFTSPMSLNRVVTIADRQSMRNATTTPCAFLITATTSLSFFSIQIASTSAQAATWTIATSTTYNSTSSPIATFPAIAANSLASQSWNGVDRQVGNMSPGTYLVASVAGITGGSQGGVCQFEGKVY